jgi:hypothetical protein
VVHAAWSFCIPNRVEKEEEEELEKNFFSRSSSFVPGTDFSTLFACENHPSLNNGIQQAASRPSG